MHNHLDKKAVACLQKIVDATGAKVVISSTWRLLNKMEHIKKVLTDHGFKGEVIGKTPNLGGPRGKEIAAWIASNGHISSFVILDDDSDMLDLKHKLVQTTFENGLTDVHVDRAIMQLSDTLEE